MASRQIECTDHVDQGDPLSFGPRSDQRYGKASIASEVATLCDRGDQRDAHEIERSRREDKGGTEVALLFTPNGRIEVNANDISTIERRAPHPISCPTGLASAQSAMSAGGAAPKSHCAIKSASAYVLRAGRNNKPSRCISALSLSPRPTPSWLNRVVGSRTAALLPHFWIESSIAIPPM